ncbi:deoxyguanosinetriphosphate triphosphohydrolase [Sandaracinobacteroides saxicola]|uniref:Deoxyguanosinetriphosphate triphosphohydrolase-like protein n=1 Tax=Sandaracinobacteroides saxicola TaxID=2759707 RepID=A0A7G5II61_9SPHN|nr:deoxyguanosinetriphosphate triphosphohydrolase [Sandaracinobacteroides saxicola]QMW23053.1 deoxyguanosinetriphosphate triphosphohydrolase [Sandaracinobacteroides saxicola]
MTARFATVATRGRQHPDTPDGTRTPFARDRDRLIHCTAFRRLRYKTQVFVAPDGDHFRVRLTHSLEVAQLARSVARSLGLNEDLTELLALGHDLGHPPFGHSGEDALTAAMAPWGGFDHNGHTVRILTRLEARTPAYPGLNLGWEALEGLAKHNGPVPRPGWALAEADAAFPLDLASHAGLEAQVAAIADDIAYNAHDLDDGLRAGLLTLDQVLADVPLLADLWHGVETRFPGTPARRLRPQLVRDLIGLMLGDVLGETRQNLAALDPRHPDDIRGAGQTIARFSAAFAPHDRALKAFLRRALYTHPSVNAVREPAAAVVTALFAGFRADPATLPDRWFETLPEGDPARARHIADYIAGMTDRFALNEHKRLYGSQPFRPDMTP